MKFLSGIITKDGNVLINPFEDDHFRLLEHFGTYKIYDTSSYIEFEFVPENGKYNLIDDYKFHLIKEGYSYGWLSRSMVTKAKKMAKQIVKKIIANGNKGFLISEVAILTGNDIIFYANHSRIISMNDSAFIRMAKNCVIDGMFDNTAIKYAINCNIFNINNTSTIHTLKDSHVFSIKDNGSISNCLNSCIDEMHGNAKVDYLYQSIIEIGINDNTLIQNCDQSIIKTMYDNSVIEFAESSLIFNRRDKSLVKSYKNCSLINNLFTNN